MTYREFLRKIEKGKIACFYLFEGKEEYFKKEALRKLKEKIVTGGEDFNFQVLSATSCGSREILEFAFQLPFKGERQLLVVEEADKLSLKDQKSLLSYLKNPVKSTCVVFTGDGFDHRTGFYNFFGKEGKIVFFRPLNEFEMIEWIREKVEDAGKIITEDAAFELYRRIGKDLFLLEGEIEKLVAFVHPSSCIESSHVRKITGERFQEDIFDFLDIFKKKDLPFALYRLNRLFLKGEDPLGIVSMLAREIRILLFLKFFPNINPSQACQHIFKRHSGFLLEKTKEYIDASTKFSLPWLFFAHQKILETELSIKKGKKEPTLALQQTVIDILSN